jgi:hypothetical protein
VPVEHRNAIVLRTHYPNTAGATEGGGTASPKCRPPAGSAKRRADRGGRTPDEGALRLRTDRPRTVWPGASGSASRSAQGRYDPVPPTRAARGFRSNLEVDGRHLELEAPYEGLKEHTTGGPAGAAGRAADARVRMHGAGMTRSIRRSPGSNDASPRSASQARHGEEHALE